MKKNLLLAIAGVGGMLLSSNYASAQEAVGIVEESVITEVPVECKTNYSTSWKDNWFIQLGAGVQIPYVDHYLNKGDDKRHITPVYNVGFGHWFSPYLGFRVTGYYGRLHLDWGKYNKANMANANVDLMWDMFNSFAGPNPNRVFSIIPFVGVGGTYTWGFDPSLATIPDGDGHRKTKQWTLPVSAGLQLRFALCKYVDFFAEGRVNFYGDEFNNVVSGDPIEANVSVYGGFSFNIGGRNYSAYNPCEYLGYINTLNNQVNDLRGQLATTAAALAAAEAQLPCPEVVEQEAIVIQTPILASVRFKIDSARISNEEMVNVYNVAEYMKANPNVTVTVQGYADKDTGTAAYNMELSQRRAQAVVDALVNKYGVDSSRLTINANGSDTQPYSENNWNRIVIFTQP
ncbi:MAG: OmpA family protein [Paramuribaculum sp.]|nr:OmpA family protein [Bacteroides sp.]MDE7459686.1 OmpA family protein [Paramuribaculum sp.]